MGLGVTVRVSHHRLPASQVVEQVMRGMRRPDEPYRNHGAATAVRYCSPTNGASSLTPEAFAGYLREPWYKLLLEWEEMVRAPTRAPNP